MAMTLTTPLPENHIRCRTLAEWHAWLAACHERTEGIWLVFPRLGGKAGKARKKAESEAVQPEPFAYEASVREALCWGWIDSKPGKVDQAWSMRWFAPRRKGSAWSAKNKAMVAELEAEGRMQPAGRAAIARARADGSWTFLDEVEAGIVPSDLNAALDAHPPAAVHFEAFPKSVKRGILEWIKQAKRPQTRSKRILETAELAQQNQRANQWPR